MLLCLNDGEQMHQFKLKSKQEARTTNCSGIGN